MHHLMDGEVVVGVELRTKGETRSGDDIVGQSRQQGSSEACRHNAVHDPSLSTTTQANCKQEGKGQGGPIHMSRRKAHAPEAIRLSLPPWMGIASFSIAAPSSLVFFYYNQVRASSHTTARLLRIDAASRRHSQRCSRQALNGKKYAAHQSLPYAVY